ncbi:diguanylate cyclase [Thalassotalea euphylliae]|uniref:transporter substrate-binding domain-containing diguanylate cyclase n=1 Tax=Thalassotalea euphylliae TaxID=1655234 RepID=UPI00363257C5
MMWSIFSAKKQHVLTLVLAATLGFFTASAMSKPLEVHFSPNWSPLNMDDEAGKLIGINIDFAELISQKAGHQIKLINNPLWVDVLDNFENGRVDMTLGASNESEEWSEIALFSKPYASFPVAVATQTHRPFVSDFSYLQGKKIAVGINYNAYHILQEQYPNFHFVEVDTTYEGLELLAAGEVYAVADILPVLTQRLIDYGYTNLKIGGVSEHVSELRVMINKNRPDILADVNEAIDRITPKEQSKILAKWLNVHVPDDKVNPWLVYGLSTTAFVLLVTGAMLIRLKRKHARLSHAYIRDKLTETYTREYAEEELYKQQTLFSRTQQDCSVVLLDIDRFKQVNDNFGHAVGDKVLIQFAQVISKRLRGSDVLARWGGEEFMLILPNTGIGGAEKLMLKLKDSIKHTQFTGVKRVSFTAGIAAFDGTTLVSDIVKKADVALYHGKNNGRNQIVIDGTIQPEQTLSVNAA